MEYLNYNIIISSGISLSIILFFIKRWINGIDNKFAGIFNRQDELSQRLARLEGVVSLCQGKNVKI